MNNASSLSQPMHIAIDGPAGAGKSTVCKQIASRLGMLFLDTGAMYRAATIGLFDNKIDREDDAAVAAYVCQQQISFDDNGDVCLAGQSLGQRIRTPECTAEIYRVANNPLCRAHLVALQQAIVNSTDTALEGRDTTTVICPNAELKIYLDASPAERARRRLAQWQADGSNVTHSLEEITADIEQRDQRDRERSIGALSIASDAFIIHTDNISPQQVVTNIVNEAMKRCPRLIDHG